MRLLRLLRQVTAPIVFILAMPLGAAVSISTTTPSVETFDGIGTVAAASLPPGFKVDRPAAVRTAGAYGSAASATTLLGGANLSSTASNGIYNFGSGTTTTGSDRAIGFLSSGSGTQSGNLYVQLVNNSGGSLSGVKLSYDVEKYRGGTNVNGFRIQMFYSVDGTSWTSAGADFLTHFAADAANAGFSTAPGATAVISNKSLNVTVPSGGNLYLAWNYSVAATSTTTNAQALAIDNISVLGIAGTGSTNPSGTGAANPNNVTPGGVSLLSVTVTPGTNPPSTLLSVTGNLSSIGGSASQAFVGAGNVFTFQAIVSSTTTAGMKVLPVTISDAEGRLGNTSISLIVEQPIGPVDHIVISQIYGGGGNSGATYRNDFVELYNPSSTPFNLAGWTLQYASATGSGWGANDTSTPLGGVIGAGQYLLVSLASGSATGAALPEPNITGLTNMSATAGKVALVRNGDFLSGTCPLSDPDVVDFVGYGATANCSEGDVDAPGASNTTAVFRKGGGSVDTNNNGNDFESGAPNPRRTAPIVEIGPAVVNTEPAFNGTNAPRDASITVTFTEPVDVTGAWFDVSCVSTGLHNDATVGGGPRSWVIIPNTNFLSGEQCTVTINKDQIHDRDLDDSAPNTDTLAANYSWSFTTSTGTAPPYSADVHLTFGNPSGALADVLQPNNYLMMKPEFALSYNRDRGTPNWVSWHLTDEWVGSLTRVDTFRPDPAVPPDWYRVLGTDYFSSGFDRGHMVPNADRDKETSIPINQATFLMTNMIPQAPENNQGPWANMENFLRTLLPANEVYIVAGGAGVGGTGTNGPAMTIANGRVTVPAQTWKVALVLPKDAGNDVGRATAATRTIAVIMPNTQGIQTGNPNDWMNYLVTVDQVEALTGYNFFSNVADIVENSIEAGIHGVNPPGVANQSLSMREDSEKSFTLETVSATGNPLVYTIVGQPAHGTLGGSDGARTYAPAPDFNGTDSFTFRVSDGALHSITATVTITVLEVNDAPLAADDARNADEDVALAFAAGQLLANDTAGPANESGQMLTVTSVSPTSNTHGTVVLLNGQVTYTPEPNFNGAASFTYQVCDNGVTAGLSDSLCAIATVNVTVSAVNDKPSASVVAPSTSEEGSAISATVTVSDADAGDSFTYAWTVAKNSVAYGAGSSSAFTFTPDDDGTYVVSVRVTDHGGSFGDASATIVVSNVMPVIAAVAGPDRALQLGSIATINIGYTDAGAADTHTANIVWDDGSSSGATCSAGVCTASHTYASPGVYGVAITVTDDDGGSASARFDFVIVYASGLVTGGGWINSPAGSYVANPALAGKATFNLVANNQKSNKTLSGNTQFKLSAGDFDFDGTSLEWLVVASSKAQYRGTGTVNGAGGFGFIITVIDGDAKSGIKDSFRIRIWEIASGETVYDNAAGSSDDIDSANPQPIDGGSIVVHAK